MRGSQLSNAIPRVRRRTRALTSGQLLGETPASGHARPWAFTGARKHWQALPRGHIFPKGSAAKASTRAHARAQLITKRPREVTVAGVRLKAATRAQKGPPKPSPLLPNAHTWPYTALQALGCLLPVSPPRSSHGESGVCFSAMPVALGIPASSDTGRFLQTTAEGPSTHRPKLHWRLGSLRVLPYVQKLGRKRGLRERRALYMHGPLY